VKKVISIGIALALLTMAVTPAITAAQYTDPDTYAKIPFAIIGSFFYLLQNILDGLTTAGLLPDTFSWLPDLMPDIGDWVAGPLSWTVDMMAWGLGGIGGTIMSSLDAVLADMGIDLGGIAFGSVGDLLNDIACAMFAPFGAVSATPWDPCA
jgi:hypothetical protein